MPGSSGGVGRGGSRPLSGRAPLCPPAMPGRLVSGIGRGAAIPPRVFRSHPLRRCAPAHDSARRPARIPRFLVNSEAGGHSGAPGSRATALGGTPPDRLFAILLRQRVADDPRCAVLAAAVSFPRQCSPLFVGGNEAALSGPATYYSRQEDH